MRQSVTAALVIVGFAVTAHAAAPTSSRTLSAKLAKSGRAEAKFVEQVVDPLGEPRQRSGSVALESGQRVRLDYGAGEALTLRPDGGEWIQPDLGQLIRLGPAGSEVTRIWQLLVGGGGAGLAERPRGKGKWTLIPAAGDAVADSAHVDLDAAGLPARLAVFIGPEQTIEYRFQTWRFSKARGRSAFVLTPKPGMSVIEAH
jgi:outer membrane lipoprotein-sorting protein